MRAVDKAGNERATSNISVATIKTEFEYTGGVQSVKLPAGSYKFEVWGAQGGPATSLGGYATGEISFSSSITLYIHVGQKGPDFYEAPYRTTDNYGGGRLASDRRRSGGR
jgi:hypothetical protein